MSINGITNPLLASLGSVARPDVARTSTERAQPNGTTPNGANRAGAAPLSRPALKTQTPIAGQAATQSAVPVEAPAGTDPTLWSVLTSDERNYFAKTSAMGPLTYSRIKDVTHPTTPAARGVRLDVRA
jgi:hypothetical protein